MAGSIRFEMGGEWDIDDLGSLSGSLRLTYAYFYWLYQAPDSIEPRVRSMFARYFWSGEYIGDRFSQDLYYHIPTEHRLRLGSIHYSSPGWLELVGSLPVLVGLAFCARAWIGTADKALDLFTKIDKFFEERKLRKIAKSFNLTQISPQAIDEAHGLCFDFGAFLGFDNRQIESMIELTGNPISTLRLLVSLSKESRRMAELETRGKLKLPRKT